MHDYWNDPPDDERPEHPVSDKIAEYLADNGVPEPVRDVVLDMGQDIVDELVHAVEADCPVCLERLAREARST